MNLYLDIIMREGRNKMDNYEEVAEKKGLPSEMKAKYVLYMRTRWADEEKIQCQTGYAIEWANRFLSESEYEMSDSIGQSVLRNIDKKGEI